MNNEINNQYIDPNECTARGACSIAPNISALQELVIYFLRHLAYYVVKLEDLGGFNPSVKFAIINTLSGLVSINELNEKQLYSMLLSEYKLYSETKKTYFEICKLKNIQISELKNTIIIDETLGISNAINIGEKLILSNSENLTQYQKSLKLILRMILKSTSINLVKLNEFDIFDENTYHKILKILDLFNHGKVANEQIIKYISKLAKLDNCLQLKISDKILENYGDLSKTEVSHSTRNGKAILVSGSNFVDLMNILNETQDKGIDIYTHSQLLLAHALEKFKKFPHLQGHYGDVTENCILDFATFPGAILLTKTSGNNTVYLYRGKIFSNDYIIPQGITKIENNDYSELIKSANEAKGFSKGLKKPITIVGYNQNELNSQLNELVSDLKNNTLKRLFIVGLNPYSELQNEYFKEFLSNINEDEFVLSFSINCEKKNVLTINTGNRSSFVIRVLQTLFIKTKINSENISFFFPKCDVTTISNIVRLKDLGVKNIYMGNCSPTVLNPTVLNTFASEYNVNITSTPIEDLNQIRER